MRKFLYAFVVLTFLLLAGLFALRIYADELTEIALVPSSEFVAQDALGDNAYHDPAMWFSRPGMNPQNDPARWQPSVATDPESQAGDASTQSRPDGQGSKPPEFAVFFIHPTSFYEPTSWNAPLNHADSQNRARLMLRGMASAFNQASEIWAPRYRQATFGAFLTNDPKAQQALDAAYGDIDQAFELFLDSIDADMPIVIAGHSQGGYHITRLLAERAGDTALMARIAAAYPIGWPISIEHDLPLLPLPACETAQQGGCLSSWASFAEPAEPGQFLRRYETTPGLDGKLREASPILCTNPLTGSPGGSAPMGANLGTLVPNEDMTSGELIAGAVPARCDINGLLLIGDPPEMGEYVLPGSNYHVYDIPLFWSNLQGDIVRRVEAWQKTRS